MGLPRRRLLYVQFTNPAVYPPIEHSSRIMAEKGWDVVLLGTTTQGAESLEMRQHERIRVRRLSVFHAASLRKLHYLAWLGWTAAWILLWRPQWVYASDPRSTPAALLAAFAGIRVIYHEHDSPSGAGTSRRGRLVRWCRRHVAQHARSCVLPNEERARAFKREMRPPRAVLCVWNCPSRAEVDPPRRGGVNSPVWLLYHGSIVPSRLPVSVLDALALLPRSVRLRIVGYETLPHRDYPRRLRSRAEQLKLDDRVEIVGSVARRDELLEWCRRSDIGLALLPLTTQELNEQTMAGASNKPFEYLAFSMPIVIPDRPEWREIFEAAGTAVVCDPSAPASIAAAIQHLLDDPDVMRDMGERGRQRVLEEWNYEKMFAPVSMLIERGKSPAGQREGQQGKSVAR
jgi:glycosyltransferase involved in cell wall biosynthesis